MPPTFRAPALRFAGALSLLVAGLTATHPASAQNPPAPSQAAQALQQAVSQNPALAGTIRQRLQQSGLTDEQVRARLQASGYPPTLLDSYLTETVPGQGEAADYGSPLAAEQPNLNRAEREGPHAGAIGVLADVAR